MSSLAKSFSRTLLCNMSLLVAFAIGLLGFLWIFQEYTGYNRQADLMRTVQLDARKAKLKAQVENVVDYIRFKKLQTEERMGITIRARVLEAHALASHIQATCKNKKPDETRSLVREALRALRFDDGRGCYFALALDGVDQLFPDSPELEGTNVLDKQDRQGRFVFRDMSALAREKGEGFYTYTWSKPGAPGGEFTKIVYIKYFAPFDWFIGTGVYLADMEQEVQQEVLARINELRMHRDTDLFAGQWDGVSLTGPGQGENMFAAPDPEAVRTAQDAIALARTGGGFLNSGTPPALTTAYVMGIEEWQWYIAAAEHLDDINKSLALEKEAMIARMQDNIAVTISVLACLLLASFFIARRISEKTRKNFASLNSFFHTADSQSQQLDSRSLDFVEFQQLAESANRMVAERNRAMTELKENERRYRSLFDTSSDAIFILQDNRFIDCNPQALQMFGCTRDELLGQRPDRFSPAVQPDGTDSAAAAVEKNNLALSGTPQFFEWTHQRPDGSLFEAEISLNALELADKTCTQAIVRDITERKQAEKQLVRQASAIAQAAEEIIITDPDGAIEYANPAFEHITGYSLAEAVGRTYSFLASGEQSHADTEMWAAIRAGRVWRGRTATRKKDGGLLQADATVSPIFDQAGNPMGYVFVKRDVTEQIKTETMFRQSQKMEAIGTLAGGIAHDFNNILSAIFGFAEIAKLETPESSGAYRSLGKILEAAGRARDLVKQILTFSRQTEMKPHPIQPRIIINETIKLLEASLPSTIEIRTNLQAEEAVLADPTSIHQIIMNLCTNAGHAMRKNGGILDISLIAVDLDQDFARIHPQIRPGQYLRLNISDTGHGMTRDVKERIFDPFFTTKGEGEGTGMGLSVVHGIVRSLGGTIAVHSEPGKGSTFSVYLPVHAQRKIKKNAEVEQIPGGTEHIVFVDDEEFIVDIAQQMLELLGYRVVGMTDSVEAFTYFREHAGEIDLVITDYTMPRMTGLALAKEIRQIRPDLPILLCTGYNTGFSEAEIKEAGINAFILKPVVRRELATIVRRVLDGKNQTMNNLRNA
jgi:PAS domain S-box-containing protein